MTFTLIGARGKSVSLHKKILKNLISILDMNFIYFTRGRGIGMLGGMTVEQFVDFLNARRDFSFEYGGKRYALRAESDGKGGLKVFFGQEYGLMQEFEDVKELLALAKVGNSFLRAVLGYLDL